MWKANNDQGLIWHGFSIFVSHPELRHGIFSRYGGVSGSEADSLCLSFNNVDSIDNVRTNLSKAASALGLPSPAFVRQTHSDRISIVRAADRYQPKSPQEARVGYDAMITQDPGVSLLINVADCQAVILYDPVGRALGLVHSGWRGSVQNILAATVDAMKSVGSNPAHIKAGIAPSLGPCCAEFKNYRQELPENFVEFMVTENHFDFWAISCRQLTECGVKSENIEVASICTKCSSDFFSYRRGDSWARFGVMAGMIN